MTPMRQKKVAVLYGGPSAEREVSLKTGQAIFDALVRQNVDAELIDAGADLHEQLRAKKIEAAFIGLHGRWCEDGVVQGLLEWMRIPYTGSGVAASAVGMNKVLARALFAREGLPQAEASILGRGGETLNRFEKTGDIGDPPCGFPCVVKPADEGSSVGVTIVKERAALVPAIREALKYAGDILVERYIKGRELSLAWLGGEVLGAIEIRPQREFYDYAAKYTSGDTTYLFPAPIAAAEYDRLADYTRRANRALGCRGVTRTDFILSPDGSAVLLEVNTLPGMTATSLVPKIARGKGIEFDELVLRILDDAALKA